MTSFQDSLPNLNISNAYLFICPMDWRWDYNPSANSCPGEFILWSVISGKGVIEFDNRHIDLEAGDVLVLDMDKRYLAWHDPNSPIVLLPVHYRYLDENSNPLKASLKFHPRIYRRVANPYFHKISLERMLADFQRGKKDWAIERLKIILRDIDLSLGDFSNAYIETEDVKRLHGLIAEISSNPERFPSVAMMAKALQLSQAYFSRLFKKSQGISPSEFLINARIEKAKIFLRMSTHSISGIAGLLGYKNVFFFSRQFKERTGTAPKEFRNS